MDYGNFDSILFDSSGSTETTYEGSGGVVLAGSGSVSVIYYHTATGGATAAGVAQSNLISSDTATGGGVVSGSALVESAGFIFGDGGSVAGGQALDSSYVTDTASGGSTTSGQADLTFYATFTATGGGVVSGIADVYDTSEDTRIASGGSTVSGQAEIFAYYFANTDGGATASGQAGVASSADEIIEGSGGAIVGGSATLLYFRGQGGVATGGASRCYLVINVILDGQEITIGGQANSRFSYRFVAEGGVDTGSNPISEEAGLVLTIPYEFAWRNNQTYTFTYNFVWNTGQQRSYFYRVIGKPKIDECDPLQGDDCCKRFVVNIQARSLDDVCKKIRKIIGVWPIEKIQRFSRPAETAAIAEDEANGIDHTCNVLEDVDFCSGAICADFCVQYDLRESWGGYSVLEYTGVSSLGVQSLSIGRKHSFQAEGGPKLQGETKVRMYRELRFRSVACLGKPSAETPFRSNYYRQTAQGGLVLKGEAQRSTEQWKYQGGAWPIHTGPIVPEPMQVNGWIRDGDSYRVILNEYPSEWLVFSGVDPEKKDGKLTQVLVEIDRSANGLVRDDQVVLRSGDNHGENLAKDYSWPIAIPVTTRYVGKVDNPNDESLEIAIRVAPVSNRSGLEAIIRGVRISFIYEENSGRLALKGHAGVKVSHHHYEGYGQVRITGEARTRQIEYVPPRVPLRSMVHVPHAVSMSKGIPLLVRALETGTASTIITSIDQDVVGETETLDNTFSKCKCENMPISIPFSHNLAGANKLAEFVKRNGQTIPKSITLNYNKTNDSWQANLRYSGLSAMASGEELWTILFELQCTEILSGTPIGQGVWRFGLRVNQRNLNTGQDYDTRIMTAFLPDPICSKDREFRVKLAFDTLLGLASTTPQAVIYEAVVHDNIGLFKSASWINNPKLLIDMSQIALPSTQPRITLNIGT